MRKVAIIGCGAIGSELARAIDEGVVPAELVALYDVIKDKCIDLSKSLKNVKPLVANNLDELLSTKPDVVVEAASQEAVREYGLKILKSGAEFMIMSVGALLNEGLLNELLEATRKYGVKIHVPTGAIAGLDAIRALKLVGIEEVVIRTRKPIKALAKSPHVRRLGIDLSSIKEPTTIFRGSAREAVKAFPANINVSAALTLAAGVEAKVEIVADPTIDRNIHEIEVRSKASKLLIKVENVPTPTNPKTSYLATLSAIEALKEICEERGIKVGT